METSQTVTTEHQISKITYIVIAGSSGGAREHLEAKIDKLLQKDVRQNAENA